MLAAVALLVGFYVLALTVALGALALPVLMWATDLWITDLAHVWIALACVILAFTIVRSIVPRRMPFDPPGPELRDLGQPELVALIEDVAGQVGQDVPAHVYLALDMNAEAGQRGGLPGLRGRRYMLVGMPLLDALTVTQLRAIVAHEFGHFHSGDTRLLPWFTRTYDALERTVTSLHEAKSFWRRPFTWYFDFYLRRSAGIRRRQEYVADELAAQVAGRRGAINALTVLSEVALAWEVFWLTEAVPVLEGGYLVPLLKGFRRFCLATEVTEGGASLVDDEDEEDADPYDSHPSLQERVEALGRLEKVGAALPDDPRPAMELVPDPDALEYALLDNLAGEGGIRDVERLPWDEVPERVFVPAWRDALVEGAGYVPETTAADLPEALENVDADLAEALDVEDTDLAEALDVEDTDLPEALDVEDARELLGVGLALALRDAGWSLSAPPGENVALELQGARVEPFVVVHNLVEGTLAGDQWRARAQELGISELRIGPRSQPPGPAGTPA